MERRFISWDAHLSTCLAITYASFCTTKVALYFKRAQKPGASAVRIILVLSSCAWLFAARAWEPYRSTLDQDEPSSWRVQTVLSIGIVGAVVCGTELLLSQMSSSSPGDFVIRLQNAMNRMSASIYFTVAVMFFFDTIIALHDWSPKTLYFPAFIAQDIILILEASYIVGSLDSIISGHNALERQTQKAFAIGSSIMVCV